MSYVAWYVTACLALTGAVGLVNWRIDPLQFYRRAEYTPVFSDNQRYQNPGLAKNYDYETVVIGTSHAENFLPGDVRSALGERSLKLAISGSTAHEQYLILEKALATGRVHRVIWILDRLSFDKAPTAVSSREGAFPHHLYREGLRTLALYVLSTDTLRLSIDALLGRGHRDLATLNTWHDAHAFGPAAVMADWRRRGVVIDRLNRDPTRRFRSRLDQRRRSVLRNLVAPVRSHPDVAFDLVFPPYSILSYLADFRTWEHAFDERQRYKAMVVALTAQLPNVRVFDLQGVREITHDLRYYKDLEHFSLDVNRYVLESLASGRHRVDPASYPEELARQAQQVQAYRREVCTGPPRTRELCPRIARP